MGYPVYPEMRDSGVPWLGEIPGHWQLKRLKNVTSHNDEALEESTEPDFELEYVDISSVNLVDGITKTENMVFEKSPSRARRIARNGDTIISTVRTYLKAIAAIKNAPRNLVVSTGFAVIRPRTLAPEFLSYFLQSSGFVGDVVAYSNGVSYPAINPSDLVRLPAIEPPHPEQQTIARFLDHKTAQIDALIAKKEALLQKLAEKRTALISQAVTRGLDPAVPMRDSGVAWLGKIPAHWEIKRQRFLIGMNSGMTPHTGTPEFWDGDIPWVSPKDMKVEWISGSIDTLTEEALAKTAIQTFASGHVLIVVRGMILAHSFPVAINMLPVTINQDMKAISTTLDPAYLAILLRGIKDVILSLVEEAAHGTKVMRTDLFKNIRLPVPPSAEQEAIVDAVKRVVDETDLMVKRVSSAIDKLKEYRAALITAAVTGKIDVRGIPLPAEVTP